jgi:hypothetical protein
MKGNYSDKQKEKSPCISNSKIQKFPEKRMAFVVSHSLVFIQLMLIYKENIATGCPSFE